MRYWTQCREFYQGYREEYHKTGSVVPSSRMLARALVSSFRRRGPDPVRVLEVGAGTGAVTVEILRNLRPDDTLDVVEINPHYVDVLRRRFETEPLWQALQPQTRLINAPLQQVEGKALYDFVISGLPHNNFPISICREVFQGYQRLLKPAGILSYFEYLALRELKKAVVPAREQRRLCVVGRFLKSSIKEYQIQEQWVFLNFPPAVARHFCFSS